MAGEFCEGYSANWRQLIKMKVITYTAPHTPGLPFYKAPTFSGDSSPNTPSLGAAVVRPTFVALVAGYTAIVMLMCYGLSSISGCRWMYLDFLLTTGGILEEGLFAGILY